MKIINNIYLVSGASYGNLGNSYVIYDGENYFMIDSGSPNARESILERLKYWDIPVEKIKSVFMTHCHDDHTGNAKFFQEHGAKIFIGKEDSETLQRGNLGEDWPCTNHVMDPCVPDHEIEKDETFEIGDVRLEAIKAPGHTDGTIVYMAYFKDGETVLFSGDMFFNCGEQSELASTGWKGDSTYSPEKLTESFRKLYVMDLKPTLVLSGHGVPLFGEKTTDLVRAAYKYHILNNR